MKNTLLRTGPAWTLLTLLFVLSPLALTTADAQAPPASEKLWLEAKPAQNQRSPNAELVERVSPAVVNIIVSYHPENLPIHLQRAPYGFDPDSLAQGSGFIIHPDGYILSNYHVIDHADTITIRLADHSELDAHVVGADPATDVALLKVDATYQLPTVTLGSSASLHVGDSVVAIGNPLGLNHSVTAGIVSALGRRNLPIEGESNQSNFIQTDAPINPGNSGGPLLNLQGHVIGINTAVNRQGQGISFAIPIDMVKAIVPQLKERGYVLRSWLGVRIQPMDRLLARSFDLPEARGALVTEVLEQSPALAAGIQERDIILRLDDEPVTTSEHLPWLVAMTPANTSVTLEVLRNGEFIELDVLLEAIPNQAAPRLPAQRASTITVEEERPLGVQVATLTERLAGQLRSPQKSGVIVTALTDTSPVRAAGLRHRDIIIELGGQPVDSEERFFELLDQTPRGAIVQLKLIRRGRVVYMAFTR